MATLTYDLILYQDFVIIKIAGQKLEDKVYVPGKTRKKVTEDVFWLLRNITDLSVNQDRLQGQLDNLIWKDVPKHKWY
jgi:hypothetical protein